MSATKKTYTPRQITMTLVLMAVLTAGVVLAANYMSSTSSLDTRSSAKETEPIMICDPGKVQFKNCPTKEIINNCKKGKSPQKGRTCSADGTSWGNWGHCFCR